MSGAAATRPFETFEDFWPFYVSQHSKAWTRRFHFAGTTGALVFIILAAALRKAEFLPLAPIFAYGLAWTSHFFIEKNRPATFTHPLWSLRGDFRMYGLMLCRRMEGEARRLLSPS